MNRQNTVDFLLVGVATLVAQSIKNPPETLETGVLFLSRKDLREEGNGNLLQYSCLENSMDTGTWQATVHGVT